MTKSGFLALATAGVFLCLPAYAQGAKEEGHDANHDVYQHWMMPGSPGVSCCQEKKNGVGDCYPTPASSPRAFGLKSPRRRSSVSATRTQRALGLTCA